MKKENENKYYNIEDEINFEKMNNFKKFNLEIKKIFKIKIKILSIRILTKIILTI